MQKIKIPFSENPEVWNVPPLILIFNPVTSNVTDMVRKLNQIFIWFRYYFVPAWPLWFTGLTTALWSCAVSILFTFTGVILVATKALCDLHRLKMFGGSSVVRCFVLKLHLHVIWHVSSTVHCHCISLLLSLVTECPLWTMCTSGMTSQTTDKIIWLHLFFVN